MRGTADAENTLVGNAKKGRSGQMRFASLWFMHESVKCHSDVLLIGEWFESVFFISNIDTF